jgi:hypothetical protein
VRRK